MKKLISKVIVCLLTVFSISPALIVYPVQADAGGFLAGEVKFYDAGSEKAIDVEDIYSDLKAELYENGKRIDLLSSSDSQYYYARFILGCDADFPFSVNKLKLGNQYKFKVTLPGGYVLDRIYLYDYFNEPLPAGYKVQGDSITFTYDKTIQEQVKRTGIGGGFSTRYYLKNISAANGPLTTEIKLAKTDYQLAYGAKTFNLKAKVINGAALTYKSSDPSVISVNKKGNITVKNPGKAAVTVSSKKSSKYSGQTKKVTFTVLPKKVTSVKASSTNKRKLKVSWKKVPSASGYKIQYADNKKMKNYHTATVKKGTTHSKTLKNLPSGKYVYIRVQAYRNKKGVVVTGKWSKVLRSSRIR